MGIIYCWHNKNNGKSYIGQTINPNQRKSNHIHCAFKRQSDYYFHRALRKHGLASFEYSVLEEIEDDCEVLTEKENFYIKKNNSIWPHGYNQGYARQLSKAAREKMSQTKKEKWNQLSEEDKKERIDRLVKSNTGRKQTDYQKERARESNQKCWIITKPDGTTIPVTNLRSFCEKEGLGSNGQSNLTRGKYKGYKAQKV